MEYTQLGASSLMVSSIGFGCMSLRPGAADNERLLQEAAASGINFFDTADLYDRGENERLVGKALKERRRNVIIATKVGNQWRPDGSGWDWNPKKAYILSAVEDSLRRLDTDYIDLYQLHGGTIEDPFEETLEAFHQLQQQGKVLYYGISSIRPNVIRRWTEHSALASVMMQYSLLDRRPEESALPLLQNQGIGVLARGGLAQGLLAGKPAKYYLNHTETAVSQAAQAVKEVSGPHRSPAQTALRYVLQHPAVTSVIAGIRTQEQLNEARGAVESPALTPEELAFLRGAVRGNVYEQHR
ncbi:MAG TPA: aldo/keto reductase [Chitinophagaceae bacterium]|jgi:aryl-alcohol dehydrogenase-like predicted oxidoreductase|nr:aldo/keto reductase [Chitinophagaceae bacterium]